MTGNEIRSQFLKYFADKGHALVDSSSLVPHDDPTLLFTNAGMVQFKRLFMGEESREYVRATTCQRCVRAGGKHNDLENVGHTARHHTFFEMLGNFSFGDYFKKEAIFYAWDFLTNVVKLPKEKLWVSVFEEDDEAYFLWEKIDGLPQGHIVRLGEKDNFWAMGDTGPCGPCSEILIDQGPSVGCRRPECRAGCDCDRYLELWNLVFMQYYRDQNGKMTPLPKPSIDTGMGLERIAAVVQGKQSNYDSDLFSRLIADISGLTGKKYGEDEKADTAMRVIADHCRVTAFLVADGVLPSNEGRGYVLRRIMRRAVRFGRSLELDKPFLAAIAAEVIKLMAGAYPHLNQARELLAKVALHEEERFRETLDNGLAILSSEIKQLKAAGETRVVGDFIFKLYDTYGFPIDIVQDVALEHGLIVDEAGFASAMEAQRLRSQKSWKEGGLAGLSGGVRALLVEGHKARFVGYETTFAASRITSMVGKDGEVVDSGAEGDKVSVFCPETPFYAESGGQIGDQGEIIGTKGRGRVTDVVIAGNGVVLHEVEITEGSLAVGDEVTLEVEEGRRQRIANNHTATHILQAAMKLVLGDHVKQSGSLVTPERLRFDFTHYSQVTPEEIARIERIANKEIRANLPVQVEFLDRDEAVKSGAIALFGEKYDRTVRVVSVGDFSKELCGGTHVAATGEIGLIKIVAETAIAAGVRRIEAITGGDAFGRFQQTEKQLVELANRLKSVPDELLDRVDKLLASQKELEKEVSRLTAKLSLVDLDSMIETGQMIEGVRVVAAAVSLDNPKTLREIGDRVRDRLGTGVAVLGGVLQGKVALLAIVSKDLTKNLHAGDIVKKIASIVGGKGGGRPDMAQAGGALVDKLPEALNAVPGVIAADLKNTGD